MEFVARAKQLSTAQNRLHRVIEYTLMCAVYSRLRTRTCLFMSLISLYFVLFRGTMLHAYNIPLNGFLYMISLLYYYFFWYAASQVLEMMWLIMIILNLLNLWRQKNQ